MQFQGATKQEANPATMHSYYEGKSSGMENQERYSSSGVPFCVTVGGHDVHASGEMCVCECVCQLCDKKCIQTTAAGGEDNCCCSLTRNAMTS